MPDVLYTLNGSYPAPLPFRIILSNGASRTDPSTFTPEEIADAGYAEAPEQPAYDPSTHSLGWDGQNWTVDFLPPPSTDPADYPLLPWQFKAMVIYLDKDADIRAAIAQIPDPLERASMLSRYENASGYLYQDPAVQGLRAAIGMSEQELADAWMIAKDLRSSA